METNDIDLWASNQALEAALAAFPDEIAVAVALARAQRDALAAMPLDPSDAP